MVLILSLVSGASIADSGLFVIQRRVGSFTDSVSNRGRYEAVRFGESIVTARTDPSNDLRNQLSGLALLGITGIDMDGQRTFLIQRTVLFSSFHQIDQPLRRDQTVCRFHLQLEPHVLDDRLAGDLIEKYPAMSLSDDGNNGDDLCV